MLDPSFQKASVIAVGEVPGDLAGEFAQVTRSGVGRVQLDEVGALPSEARVLLVGNGLEQEDLRAILLAVRERLPSLLVIAINLSNEEVSSGGSTFADWSYAWPADRAKIKQHVGEALSAGRSKVGASSLMQPTFVALTLIGVVLVWYMLTQANVLPAYILPPPQQVWAAFASRADSFLGHMAITGAEALSGFVLGNTLAIATGIILFRYGWVRSLSLPWLTGVQAIPIVALAPLLSVWLGTGFTSKVVMASIVCYFPLVSNVLAAFAAVDRDLSRLFVFHRASFGSTLSGLLLPASYPALIAALRISGGLAVVGAIVAEFTGSDRGLGYLLLNATYRLEIDRLFVAIFLSAVLGLVFSNLPNLARLSRVGRSYAWG